MSENPEAMLANFLSIDPKVIARDLREAEGNLRSVIESTSTLRNISRKDRLPETEARIAHLMLVQAHELTRLPHVEEEFKVFYVSFGAGEVVQQVEQASFTRGKLAQLGKQMAAIRENAGLADGEYWLRFEGPEEHRALEAESERILDGISDTIFVHVLRRYDLGQYADMFENDRRRFEILREIGGRVTAGDANSDLGVQLIDRHIQKEYGDEALAFIRRRVAELRAARQWRGEQ